MSASANRSSILIKSCWARFLSAIINVDLIIPYLKLPSRMSFKKPYPRTMWKVYKALKKMRGEWWINESIQPPPSSSRLNILHQKAQQLSFALTIARTNALIYAISGKRLVLPQPAPTYFPPITVDEPKPPASYVDGGLKHNNPSAIALEEARLLWPAVKRFALVSIGTGKQGLGKLPQLPKSTSILLKIPFLGMFLKTARGVAALKAMARLGVQLSTASDEVHERINKVANSEDPDLQYPYYRFDADGLDKIELHEWNKIQELGEITTGYMEREDNSRAIGRCVKALINPATVECYVTYHTILFK